MRVAPAVLVFRLAILVCAFAPGSPSGAASGPVSLFNQANHAYSLGDYEEAATLYRQCLEAAQSVAVHYNLANTYTKLSRIGEAVLHFEKALVLEPAHAEAQANLTFIREASGLTAKESDMVQEVAHQLTLNAWCWVATFGIWGSIFLLLLPPLFGGGSLLSRVILLLSLLAIPVSIAAVLIYHKESRKIVILRDDTALRVAPSSESPPNAYILAGEIASIRTTHNEYFFVSADTGDTGWITEGEFGRIW